MITVLCGGFGAARFLAGLRENAGELCCVVNTADDLDWLGLHVSPDLDSVLYALAGHFDEERGWGLRGDTFACNAALARHGLDWFHVGDEDMAQHLERTRLLREGAALSDATAQLARAWGVAARLLPMTDAPVRTMVSTDEGTLSLQEYLVRRRAEPVVTSVDHAGLAAAEPAPGVLEALTEAEVVVLAPSNPVSSLGPILELAGVRAALRARPGGTVAVTPVVTGRPPGTPPEKGRARVREAFLRSRGIPHRAAAVAGLYAGLVDGFVLDERDGAEATEIAAAGTAVLCADTLAATPAERTRLGEAVLRFGRG
ncbi:MAG TPA: 2-phospho-L-lactate transferase [Candidatus Dormibacteraeota bacterium]|jgi:LPPG:FO 2-phospho-L-lactate transferase|nr:2-phospho-L-lactate transferase [Candidatus Dormibacteraeota bacterium]